MNCTMELIFPRKYVAPDGATIGRKSSVSRSFSTPRVAHYNRAGTLIDEIGNVSLLIAFDIFDSSLHIDHRRVTRGLQCIMRGGETETCKRCEEA